MKNWRIWLILALLIIAGATVYLFLSSSTSQSYQGTELSGQAPDFQLTGQNGSSVNLSDFRGEVVILTFMDTKCQNTCPLTAAHFREVYRQLNQDERQQVVFLGVNVNVEENTVANVLETTRAWHLDEIPSWHFLTGDHLDLEPVWKDYGVSAAHSPDENSIMHTPGIFLIDRLGQIRWYISTPFPEQGEFESVLRLNELLVKRLHEILREN